MKAKFIFDLAKNTIHKIFPKFVIILIDLIIIFIIIWVKSFANPANGIDLLLNQILCFKSKFHYWTSEGILRNNPPSNAFPSFISGFSKLLNIYLIVLNFNASLFYSGSSLPWSCIINLTISIIKVQLAEIFFILEVPSHQGDRQKLTSSLPPPIPTPSSINLAMQPSKYIYSFFAWFSSSKKILIYQHQKYRPIHPTIISQSSQTSRKNTKKSHIRNDFN